MFISKLVSLFKILSRIFPFILQQDVSSGISSDFNTQLAKDFGTKLPTKFLISLCGFLSSSSCRLNGSISCKVNLYGISFLAYIEEILYIKGPEIPLCVKIISSFFNCLKSLPKTLTFFIETPEISAKFS